MAAWPLEAGLVRVRATRPAWALPLTSDGLASAVGIQWYPLPPPLVAEASACRRMGSGMTGEGAVAGRGWPILRARREQQEAVVERTAASGGELRRRVPPVLVQVPWLLDAKALLVVLRPRYPVAARWQRWLLRFQSLLGARLALRVEGREEDRQVDGIPVSVHSAPFVLGLYISGLSPGLRKVIRRSLSVRSEPRFSRISSGPRCPLGQAIKRYTNLACP